MSQSIILGVCLIVSAISFAATIGDVVRRTRTTIVLRLGRHDYKITGRTTTDEVVAMLKKEFVDQPQHGRRRVV